MAEEPKAGGAGEAAVAEPGKPSAEPVSKPEADKAPETPEQRLARLEAENEAHRKTQAEWQRKVEEANRVLKEREAAAVQPPPTAPQADPLEVRIAALEQQARTYPDDASVGFALDMAYAARAQRDQQRIIQQNRAKFEAMPEKHRARAWDLWVSGQAATPEIALQAARGEAAGDIEKTAEQLAREREEIEKDRKAREVGRVGLGSRPIVGPDKAAGTSGKIRVTMAEWNGLDDLPLDKQREYLRAYNEGRVEFADS